MFQEVARPLGGTRVQMGSFWVCFRMKATGQCLPDDENEAHVCMYMCVCTGMHACTWLYMQVCVCTRKCVHTCRRAYMCTMHVLCVTVHTHACVHTCMYTLVHVFLSTCTYMNKSAHVVYACPCTHMFVPIYAHSHVHTCAYVVLPCVHMCTCTWLCTCE